MRNGSRGEGEGRGEKEIEQNIQRIFENSKLDAKH